MNILKAIIKYVFRELLKIVKLLCYIIILVLFIRYIINPILIRWNGTYIDIFETVKSQGIAVSKLGQMKVPIQKIKEEQTKIQQDEISNKLKEVLSKLKSAVYLTQEYPSSQGYTYLQEVDLKKEPAVMTWQESEQPFWLGIANMMLNKNYKNPILFLNFKDKIKVRIDSKSSLGWQEMEPNSQYYLQLNGDLQPMVTYRLNPLFVQFPKEGDYSIHFGIRGNNELPIDGEFLIKVRKLQ